MDSLIQLRRFLRLREEHWDGVNAAGQLLFARVIFARFVDCCEAGLGREARETLRTP